MTALETWRTCEMFRAVPGLSPRIEAMLDPPGLARVFFETPRVPGDVHRVVAVASLVRDADSKRTWRVSVPDFSDPAVMRFACLLALQCAGVEASELSNATIAEALGRRMPAMRADGRRP